MQLTKIERLNLIHQYLILEKLYPESQPHYSELRQALEDGYSLHYSWCFESLGNDMPEDECRKVLDILDMYRAIAFSSEKIKSTKVTEHYYNIFRGFDGNEEGQYMQYTNFFIKKLGRFDELLYGNENRSFNSHSNMLKRYSRMLNIWINEMNKNYDLNEEQILKILEA
ncbi:YfbU family protein [Acinetobacter sp. ANC 3781]|jgi:uncharacterized protein YfbU (UPF0304 family)